MSKNIKNACVAMLVDKKFDKNEVLLIQPLEICLSFYDENFEFVSNYLFKIKPLEPISNKIMFSHHIQQSRYENGLTWEELDKQLYELSELKELIANGGTIRNHTFGTRSDTMCLKYVVDKMGGSEVAKGISMVANNIQEFASMLSKRVFYENQFGYRSITFSRFKIKDAFKIIYGTLDEQRLGYTSYVCSISHEVSKWLLTTDDRIVFNPEDENDLVYINKYNKLLFEDMVTYLNNKGKSWVEPFERFLKANGWLFEVCEEDTVYNKYTKEKYKFR